MSAGPLAGIRILEVGHMLAGPYATMMLADLGAEVTKIEPPGGDISRQVSDSYFASLNRGKKSVCLELATDEGQRRLGELVAESHALLVNLKPSGIHKLGLTYEALKKHNEKIVCVALTGYGLEAGDDPAFDYVIQAATGIAALTGDPDGPPTLPGYSSADNSTGLTAALGLLAQIVSGRGGQSRRIAARGDAVAAELPGVGVLERRCRTATASKRSALVLRSRAIVSDTADGYLALFITHDGFWRLFCRRGRASPAFTTMAERAANRDEVLADRFRGARPTDTALGLGVAVASARHPGGGGADIARGA